MLCYVILEDIQQKHRFFSIFLPHFPTNTWAFHGLSTGFPHFLGKSLAPDLPTGQQASASGLAIDSTQVWASKFSAEREHPWDFFGFSPGFFLFFSDVPGKYWKMTWKWWNWRNGLLDEFWTIPGSLDGRKSGVSAGVFVAFQLWFWMVYESTTPVIPMIQVADKRWPDGHFTALAERILTETMITW